MTFYTAISLKLALKWKYQLKPITDPWTLEYSNVHEHALYNIRIFKFYDR